VQRETNIASSIDEGMQSSKPLVGHLLANSKDINPESMPSTFEARSLD
jgi:hypothetical protein